MILKNKNTGEIISIDIIKNRDDGSWVWNEPESLKSLNEEWEDYAPKEPLIKDEKIRKVFREWAGFFGAEQFRVTHLLCAKLHTTVVGSTDLTAEPSIDLPGHIGEDSEIYTIEELCGEEKE